MPWKSWPASHRQYRLDVRVLASCPRGALGQTQWTPVAAVARDALVGLRCPKPPARMAPVVLTELLSDPKLPAELSKTLSELPLIAIGAGYWQRAGALRAKVLAKRCEARLGDALIAQSCMDRGIPLLTRDLDFQAFAEAACLDLAIGPAAG